MNIGGFEVSKYFSAYGPIAGDASPHLIHVRECSTTRASGPLAPTAGAMAKRL